MRPVMEVITSHTNADFDALASMIAAKKLYPEAKLVFPGAQEKSMRNFFLESTFYVADIERLKNIDVSEITKLIVVDNRNPARLGKLAEAVGKPGVSIDIYDHHPHAPGDIKGDHELIEDVGATTTLMIELLRKRGLPITPLEATIYALGIYEETGSLTYTSTRERDAQAAAYLIANGANLNIVSDFISHELTPEQTAVMNDLLRVAASYDINGVRVVIAAFATSLFVPDLAALAHKIRDMESLDVLFLVVQMGDKAYIVARSRIPQVNTGRVLEKLGGGGHATAASAVIKDMTYLESKEKLIDLLKKHIKPGKTAGEIMTSPVKTIPAQSTVAEANEAMARFSVNVLPVLSENKFLGIISREVVQKALFHGLGTQKIEGFMTTGVPFATTDVPMSRIERIMIEERQRFIPVLNRTGSLIGAITRTDLLRSLHEERLSDLPGEDEIELRATRNVRGLLDERLVPDIRNALTSVAEVADQAGFPVYLVGGIVRDLFLRVTNVDVDIVVEGDGITFAGMLVKRLGGRMKTHQKFGTAVVVLPSGAKLDIATARLEYYESPAAMPTVELSSIKKDLYRRDFTINTLAVRLDRKRFGELLDFFGGVRDLKEKTIRILHNLSFVEDPTRVFRAIRFEQRFTFQISKHTQNLIKTAVEMKLFDRLSGARMYAELVLMFSESEPLKAIRRMQEFNLLQFIHPHLTIGAEGERLFLAIHETLTWFKLLYLNIKVERWFLYLLGLLDRLKDEDVESTLERLAVPQKIGGMIATARARYRDVLHQFNDDRLPPSRIYDLLKPLSIEPILLMMSKTRQETAKRYISLYLTRLRDVKISLTGDDLKALGIPPGPKYQKILSRVLDAKLDGIVFDREEEIAFVKSLRMK